MQLNEIEFDKESKRIIEQAYVSADHVLNDEQKRKLIQGKFERARVLRDALEKSPILDD